MVKKSDMPRHIIDSAMRAVRERGWRGTPMHVIAAEAGVTLAELYRHYPSKSAILAALARQVDTEVLEQTDEDLADEPARDRLFDVMMRRFDAAAPYRAALVRIIDESGRDPAVALTHGPQVRRSMAWMLEAAGLSSEGPLGFARTLALSATYAAVLRVWMNDDSADLARTMAALDSRLKQLESMAVTVDRYWPASRRMGSGVDDAGTADPQADGNGAGDDPSEAGGPSRPHSPDGAPSV